MLDFSGYFEYSNQAIQYSIRFCVLCYVCCFCCIIHSLRCNLMRSICSLLPTNPSCRVSKYTPFICWIFGILIGFFFAFTNQEPFLSLMRSVVSQPVSIVGLLVSIFLPLILSAFTFSPVMLLLICFLKAISFGFTFALASLYFYNAAWLFRTLFLFSDLICSVVLLGLCIRSFDAKKHFFLDCYIGIMICIMAVGIDYLMISPFLQGLL